MRVVPVGPGPIINRELVLVAATFWNGEPRVSIHVFGYIEPMPMHDRFFRDLVVEDDADSLTLPETQRRPEVGTGDQLDRCRIAVGHLSYETPDVCLDPRQDLHPIRDRAHRDLNVDEHAGHWSCGAGDRRQRRCCG